MRQLHVEMLSTTMTAAAASDVSHVLVVDDDPGMRRVIGDYLREHGLKVSLAGGRAEMQSMMVGGRPDILILDLKLGDTDGLDILRELRTQSELPVIIVTGNRIEEIDRIVGLELGADDYITKPFGLRELLARIRVILRRAESYRIAQAESARVATADTRPRMVSFAGWTLDRRLRKVTNPSKQVIPLTNGEYALLLAFLNEPLRPLSREQLLLATRVHEDVFDRSIDVQILRLRRRLDTEPDKPSMIRTERGVGYVFSVPVEAS